MKVLPCLTIIFFFLFPVTSLAQFYTVGDDPGAVKWYRIETNHFNIIYPEGVDSLAREYGRMLEKYRIPVSGTAGYMPGEMMKRKMPVVLHSYNALSNGSVAWAPKRMDLFTLPSAYNPEALPWTQMLAIHESRHVAQMQFGLSGALRPFNWFFGEMFNGLTAGLYPYTDMLEGDAVIAETGLSKHGRGRSADFLNYYMVAFDNGDFRNWQRWFYGSQKHYYPDHYALGYMLYGGARYIYDNSSITSDFFHNAARRPYNIFPRSYTFRKTFGKSFNRVFSEVTDSLHNIWAADKEARAPFIPAEQVTETPRRYTEYTDLLVIGDDIYALKEGYLNTKSLIRIDRNGREKFVKHFGSEVGMLYHSPGHDRIFWSETVPDERWSMKYDSKIRYMNLGGGRKKNLTEKNQLFNPNPSSTEGHIATTEYFMQGGTALTILNGCCGFKEASFPAPDSVQLVETAWAGDFVYATGVSKNGYGIYSIDVTELNEHDDSTGFHCHAKDPYFHKKEKVDWKTVLEPQPVMIKNFGTHGDTLMFTCDRTGVNELYHFDPESGDFFQITSTPYGASEFQYSEDGKTLYYSSLAPKGRIIYKTPTDSLLHKKVSYEDRYMYPVAEKLSRQEKAIYDGEACDDSDVSFSGPERYRKFPNIFNIHSWAPFYFNVDNIMNMSYDYYYEAVSLGATALIQNRLGTASAEIGYSAHKDPYDSSKWRHSGHVDFKYSGLYPVMEISLDFNDRSARRYDVSAYKGNDGSATVQMSSAGVGMPYFNGSLSLYIPFNFSGGGWNRGLIPQISYSIGNDFFDTGIDIFEPSGEDYVYLGSTHGNLRCRQTLSGSLRGYVSLGTAHAAVYPRWGIGAEIGAIGNIGLGDIMSPMGYAYMYGYLPGIIPQHGLKLTGLYQHKLSKKAIFGSAAVNLLPRGLSGNSQLQTVLSSGNKNAAKFTADYGIPICFGDISILNAFIYIPRFVLTPHFDCTVFEGGSLFSAGASFTAEFKSLLWLGFPFDFGITYSYNGGSSFEGMKKSGIPMERHFIGPVFSMTF